MHRCLVSPANQKREMTPTEPPWTGFRTDILSYSDLELYIEKILLFGIFGLFFFLRLDANICTHNSVLHNHHNLEKPSFTNTKANKHLLIGWFPHGNTFQFHHISVHAVSFVV